MKNTVNKKILLDTNILLYAFDRKSKFHLQSYEIIRQGIEGEFQPIIADKTLYELYRVLTSRAFQKKIPQKEAQKLFNFYLKNEVFEKIISTKDTPLIVSALLNRKNIKSKHIFDVVLVAMMLENNINTIYTKNLKDFNGIKGLKVIDPV